MRPSARRRRTDGELTAQRVLDAAAECILQLGYYQASSNEIARRAGVTWGVIQHQFGTREGLLLAVLNDRWARMEAHMESADVSGQTLQERLTRVFDVLAEHYGAPEHLVQLQILLDLSHNPKTSAETRRGGGGARRETHAGPGCRSSRARSDRLRATPTWCATRS